MLFGSFTFLVAFLPLALLGFHLLGRRNGTRAAIGWVVLCSCLYYAWWNPPYLGLLFTSIVANLWFARWLQARRRSGHRGKGVLGCGVTLNLLLLGYFKYAGFAVETTNHLFGGDASVPEILLPIGVSFFTFQQIAYLVDTYQGKTGHHGLLDYVLFVTFFPQLIAGPIVHHSEMLPQFARPDGLRLRAEQVGIGMTIFLIGLAKKLVIADNVARFSTPIFEATAGGYSPSFIDGWIAALAYAFQIYFDFSGYSDMAIGLGILFGIRLPMNFDSPYKSESIIDFWRRWHMTLSRFLRDYLYIPLGGSRHGKPRRYLNLLLTMLLGGLWHGAGWTFVIWGGLHGLYLCINHATRALVERYGVEAAASHPAARWLGRGLTFGAVCVAWVFFRAESLDSALQLVGAMSGADGWEMASMVSRREALAWVLALTAGVQLLPNTHELMGDHAVSLEPPGHSSRPRMRWWDRVSFRAHPTWVVIALLLALACNVALSRGLDSEFIYYQF